MIPYYSITLSKLKLSCPICGTINEMNVIGFTLPQNEIDLKEGCVRFVLQSSFGDTPIQCDCILPFLMEHPIVSLYANNDCGKFN